MTLTDQLLTVARAYCAAVDLSAARVSTLIFNDGKKLDLIERGKDLGTKNLERAMQWLSDHWPPEAEWPLGVARPIASPPTAPDATSERAA